MVDHKAYAAQLRDLGLKATPTRLQLLEAFEVAEKPLSLQSEELDDTERFGDRTTVYRNLLAFEEKALITRVVTSGKREYYELADAADHAHIYCDSCGTVECLESAPRTPRPKAVLGWTNVSTDVTYHGNCSSCGD